MKDSAKQRVKTAFTLVTIALVAYGATWAPYLVESWKIRQLDSEDPEIRDAAAKWLGEHKAARAVPKLIELFRQEPDTSARDSAIPHPSEYVISKVGQALIDIGRPAASALVEVWHPRGSSVTNFTASRAQWLLRSIGADAVPALVECVERHEDRKCLRNTLLTLDSMGDSALSAVPALRQRAGREGPKTAKAIATLISVLQRHPKSEYFYRTYYWPFSDVDPDL
ncbi:MAG: HEAT repeat domain-containing protein [Planctomycetota bacterium]